MTQYCNAAVPSFLNTFSAAKAIFSTGKKFGFGNPPAKEIISGREETFKISLINDSGIFFILSEKGNGLVMVMIYILVLVTNKKARFMTGLLFLVSIVLIQAIRS